MNLNDHLPPDLDPFPEESPLKNVSEDELTELAEDIVRYCPSLTHLLLALGSKNKANPLQGLN